MPFAIDIGGLASTTVSTGLLDEFHNGTNDFVLFGWDNSGALTGVVEVNSPAFTTYDMRTSIGPITETGSDPFVGNWLNMATSGGDLTVTSWNDVTFTATVSGGTTVPSPNAAWLSLIGVPLAIIVARRAVKAPRKA